MSLTLGQFLDHPTVRRADPDFLGRAEHLDRLVRWVHSSEIYEIGPLLSGGEVLLTTGLGLAGADAGSRRHWVRDLAGRGVAAVALEPGRSLPDLPAEVADEARRAELPLVVLRTVVPFAEICREVNSDVLTSDLARLRRGDELVRQLHEHAADGAGLAELVSRTARIAQEPIEVRTLSGQLVAAAAPDAADRRGPRNPAPPAPPGPAAQPARSVVRAAGEPWGHVLLGSSTCVETQFLAERVAAVVGLVVQRSATSGQGTSDLGITLLTDLLDRPRFTTSTQLLTRAALAGFYPGPGQRVVGLAGSCADPRRGAVLLGRAAGSGQHLLAPVRGQVLGLIAADQAGDPSGQLARKLDAAAQELEACVVLGPSVEVDRAGDSLIRAREGLDVGPGRPGAATWRRTSMEHLLTQVPAQQVKALAEDALGPLQAWDRLHGSALLDTLAAWIDHGLNTAATARALHVRRQTVHERLVRIGTVLGFDPGDGSELAHLVVASAAARVQQDRQHP